MRRRRTPRLAATVARTAVVAGTAQSVAGRVARQQKAAEKKQQHRLTDELVDQLTKLAQLRDAGVLTEKEFAAKKAKLLG